MDLQIILTPSVNNTLAFLKVLVKNRLSVY